ncbi:MAG: hypothetical protein ACE5KA_00845 [Nitrososphaerales archaeon]
MSQSVIWFHDFLGVGYRPQDPYVMLLLLFKKRSQASKVWHEVLRWWIDDEIKIRFLEVDGKYQFVMYCETRILENTWVFVKMLKLSDHYRQFRESYKSRAFLGLAVYRPKGESHNLHILKTTKNITDVQFIQEADLEPGSIIWRSREILRAGKE